MHQSLVTTAPYPQGIVGLMTSIFRAPVQEQWLSGRVLDSRPTVHGFEPHRRHCVVSLSKNINPSLVLVQPRKTCPFITERLLMECKESNQTKKSPSTCPLNPVGHADGYSHALSPALQNRKFYLGIYPNVKIPHFPCTVGTATFSKE